MNHQPTFSINEYDSDGDQSEEGIYLHFEGCRVRVADDIDGFDELINHLIKVKTEIVENYVL